MLPRFRYHRPDDLETAVSLLSAPGAALHAGGTDLLGCLREDVFPAAAVVSISRIRSLKGIREDADGGLRIGALTTLSQIAAHPGIQKRFAALAQGAGAAASPQIRNQGTIGGNLCQKPRCWYYRSEHRCLRKGGDVCFAVGGENRFHCIFGGDHCYIVHPSDTAPALCALSATIKITGPGGPRSIPVEDFYVPPSEDPRRETVLGPGEIVTEIRVPAPPPGLWSVYRKIRARRSWDFAMAGMALALELAGNRVEKASAFLSGAAPVPWRSAGLENALCGHRLDAGDEKLPAAAAQAAVKGASPLAQNGYKIPLFRGLVRRTLSEISTG